ncbi:MAG TPA: MFS transporter [Acetobacteraceae bacterium]|jgi:PAT family beta-lactamase induction signal transducer AmpG
MAAYGFVAGLPLPLSGFTFRLWLAEGGVSLAVIGLTANIGLAYSLKFLWAPVLDNASPPGPLRRLGRRRGWLAAIQPALAAAAALLALSDPARLPFLSLALAALVAFLSASQDIVVDAWRIEVYPPHRQGAAMAAYIWGYRIALLIATTGVISLVSLAGWRAALLGVAALIGCGILITVLAPEPPRVERRLVAATFAVRLAHAVVEPLRDFLTRRGALLILAFVALFKLGEAMAGIMTAPFYRALGFSREAIAATGWFSLGGTLAGIALGGWLVARLGTGRALLRTGWAQTIAMAMYLLLAVSAGEHHVLYATVTTEAFAQGMADAAFITYLSGLCSRAFTATHYALLSSLAAIAVHTIGGTSGILAARLGWIEFYALCMFAALPSMGLMLLLLRSYPTEPARADAAI